MLNAVMLKVVASGRTKHRQQKPITDKKNFYRIANAYNECRASAHSNLISNG
jgi:hypothetical protein